MDTGSHWKPNDWIRLTALIGGFVLFVFGAVMLYQGVVAQGDIDLKSTFLSGTIKAASAGLYVCFFSVFIIVFVLATLVVPTNRQSPDVKSPHQQLTKMILVVFGILLFCAVGAALTVDTARAGFFAVMFLMAPIIFVFVIGLLSSND
jgi:hypothetical protein